MLQRAIPEEVMKGQPGTEAFRVALRDALANIKELPLAHGIMNTTATDHNGLDNRARVIVEIVDGKWNLQNE